MTPQKQATGAAPDAATAQPGRPLTVTMVTRRAPTEIGGVERVVAGLVRELARPVPPGGWTPSRPSGQAAGWRGGTGSPT